MLSGGLSDSQELKKPALRNSEGLGTGRSHQWLARQKEGQAKAVVHARQVVPTTELS